METKSVTVKKEASLPQVQVPQPAWGTESIERQDTKKSFIALCQKEKPDLEGIKVGDIYKTGTNIVIGGKEKPFEALFIKHVKEWVVTNSAGEVKSRVLYNDKNLSLQEGPLSALIEGDTCSRFLAHLFFVLVVGRENEGPAIISFMKSNKRIAEGILTIMLSNARLGKSIASQTFLISSVPATWKKFNWYSYKAVPGRASTKEEEELCRDFYMELKASQDRVEAAMADNEGGANEGVPF